ncbi:MAG: penicillin acylase family protein [Gemmatimonadetes bacterium]|nr:penicillin acylase family protein [Gemmatimonadota bacterium]
MLGEEGPGEAIAAQIEAALTEALAQLRQEQGEDPADWRWGRVNRSELPHPIVAAYDIPAVERRGGAGTVGAIGATWREIVDFNDLAASVASMFPGQSARPGSPFYDHFANSWRNEDEYFPLLWSREAVEARAQHRLTLQPGG